MSLSINADLKSLCNLFDTNMLSIKVAVFFVILVGLVIVGRISCSNRQSRNFWVSLCSELYRRSTLWSIPQIISFFSCFTLWVNSFKSSTKLPSIVFSGLYRLPTIICLSFLACISIRVVSNSPSLKDKRSLRLVLMISFLISTAVPPPL